MKQAMALYRGVFRTANRWTLLVDGTARAGIEASLASLLAPGDQLLVPVVRTLRPPQESRSRGALGADVAGVETAWGSVFAPDAGRSRDQARIGPSWSPSATATRPPPWLQPLAEIGALCRRHDVLLYVDATATLGGIPVRDRRLADRRASRRPAEMPRRARPARRRSRFNDRAAARRSRAASISSRASGRRTTHDGDGPHHPLELFRPRDAHGLLVGEAAQPPHRGGPMLYAARECARIVLEEGLERGIRAPPRSPSRALRAGLEAMGLELFGDPAHRMANVTGVIIPEGVDGGEGAPPRCCTISASRSAPRSGRCTARSGASAPWATTRARTRCCMTLGALEAVLRGQALQAAARRGGRRRARGVSRRRILDPPATRGSFAPCAAIPCARARGTGPVARRR